jgi:hypothetical protein
MFSPAVSHFLSAERARSRAAPGGLAMLLNLVGVILLLVCELFLVRFLVALIRDKRIVAPVLQFHVIEVPRQSALQICRGLGCVDRNDPDNHGREIARNAVVPSAILALKAERKRARHRVRSTRRASCRSLWSEFSRSAIPAGRSTCWLPE